MASKLPLIAEIIGILVGLIAIITGLVKAYQAISKWVKGKRSKMETFYCRQWNNQGQIKNPPSHYIDMVIWKDGHLLKGNFNVRKYEEENGWEMFELSARRRWGKLKCTINRREDAEFRLMAKGLLRKKEKTLCWSLIEIHSDQFPKVALLRMGLPSVG